MINNSIKIVCYTDTNENRINEFMNFKVMLSNLVKLEEHLSSFLLVPREPPSS